MADTEQTRERSDAVADSKKADSGKKPEDAPPFSAVVTALVVSVALLLAYGLSATASVSPLTLFAVEMLVGAAALVSGALLGFLFGIPRTPPRNTASSATGPVTHAVYEPSNNLEQVSDWLTKVLVGATLVQLKELRETLSELGLRVMQGVGGAATSVVTQLTLIVFGVLGFLAGFLWTRVYYGVIQVRADNNAFALLLENFKNEVKEDVKQQVEQNVEKKVEQKVEKTVEEKTQQFEQAKQQAEQSATESKNDLTNLTRILRAFDAAASVAALFPKNEDVVKDPALAEKIKKFRAAQPVWDSDPVKDLFGTGPSAADGLTLTGTLDRVLDDESLVLTLTVEGSEQRPIDGNKVVFLTHPTYKDSIRTVTARANRASLTLYSESWYYAAAIVETTVLVLDLRTIPGVPDWFTAD